MNRRLDTSDLLVVPQLSKSGHSTTLRFFFAKILLMSAIGIFRQLRTPRFGGSSSQSYLPSFGKDKIGFLSAYQTERYQTINLCAKVVLICGLQGCHYGANRLRTGFLKEQHDVALQRRKP